MIPLVLRAQTDATTPFVTRLRRVRTDSPAEHWCLTSNDKNSLWCGTHGLVQVDRSAAELEGDVVLVNPKSGTVERLLRAGSPHNTLLVTERCDQLCVMCSQPPKKSHVDRFELLIQACLLAEPKATIGITGGEPTLFKQALFDMIERVGAARPDLSFHILTNGQHFQYEDVASLRRSPWQNVAWGIPIYAADPDHHDKIVGKPGAFTRLHDSLDTLLIAGARVELRTVLLAENLTALPDLAQHIAILLSHVEQWSLMGLENIGFARNRWSSLHVDLRTCFDPLGEALDIATLHGIGAKLFNIPLCHLPAEFRHHAVASISDWKQRFSTDCANCRAKSDCSGFFEWHPDELVRQVTPL